MAPPSCRNQHLLARNGAADPQYAHSREAGPVRQHVADGYLGVLVPTGGVESEARDMFCDRVVPTYHWMDAAADVAETTYTPFQAEADAAPVRLIVRRVKPAPGSQLALFATYSYHAFITDRDGETLELEADHRRHAEIENAIRDLKYGVRLNHMLSARFAANRAWLAVQVMAHNLARWTARIGMGQQIVTTKTLRRRVFALAGRITRSARRLTLHLPRRWPWETQFSRALARLQAIPFPA